MFLVLCSPPRLPSFPITTLIYCCRISPTLSLLFPFICLGIIFILTHHPSFKLPADLPVNSTPQLGCCFFPSLTLVFAVCDAVRASGTTASSHLKHFRETHICCFRAQRDMPWQRLFEVASHGGTRTRTRDLRETIKKC